MHAVAGEHILLESDEREVPDAGRARITHAQWRCRSRLRLRGLELAIIDYYYLAVRVRDSRAARDYVLDLRYLDRSIGAARHIPWKCMAVTLALAGAAAFAIHEALTSSAATRHAVMLGALLLGLTLCSGLVCAWRATETLALRTLHGEVTVLEFIGGPGTLRSGRQFTRKLLAHIKFATGDRRSTRARHLRDEMREHFRLREAGVLSQQEYEASKARILAQHVPIRKARAARSGF